MRFYWTFLVASFWISAGAALGWQTGISIFEGLSIFMKWALG